jgi:hypothetical protein
VQANASVAPIGSVSSLRPRSATAIQKFEAKPPAFRPEIQLATQPASRWVQPQVSQLWSAMV